MQRYPPLARAWLILTVIAAVIITIIAPHPALTDMGSWVALAFLALCAAVAHFFPVKSTSDGATYHLTNAFLVAGAVILPPIHLTVLVLFAITPQAWQNRRRPGSVIRWSFNVAQAVVAAQITHLEVMAVDNQNFGDPSTLAALFGAAIVFTLSQNLIIGVMTSLFFHKPLRQAEPLSPTALLGDSFTGLIGAVVAGQWLSHPFLVALLLPLLVVAHRLTRSAHLAELAQVDVKTGLHNALHFEQMLEQELARAQRLRRPLALLFTDLDHFKRVNDTHGHGAGDKVLQELAGLLRGAVRPGDVVARFGGEEFVALMPGTGSAEALYLAEQLRQTVAEHPFVLPDGVILRCTISVGLAASPDDGTTVEALLEQADRAMYRAKQSRNAVMRAGALPSVPRLGDTPGERARTGNPATVVASTPNRWAAIALWATIAIGLSSAAVSLFTVTWYGDWPRLLPFLAFALVAEAMTFQIMERNQQKLTFSFTIAATLAAVVAVPLGAPLVSLGAALLHTIRGKRQSPSKMFFNLANPTLAAAAASTAFTVVVRDGVSSLDVLLASSAAVCCFYLVNIGLVSLMIALHTRRSFMAIMRGSVWSAPVNFLLGATGAFLGGAYPYLGLVGTALFALPLLVMRFTLGYYSRKSQETIQTLQAANHEVEQAHEEKEQTLGQLITTIGAIIDARDNAVSGHSDRVASYAVALGEEMGLPARELAYIRTAGLLHDLGKIGVPEAILHKPAKLTREEYAIVKEHAATGERIIAEVKPLVEVAQMVGDHHERFDGKGYPNGERGTAISRGGRIIAVADTLDSILSDRPYSKGKPLAWALEEAVRCAGEHFDPEVVDALLRVAEKQGPTFFTQTDAVLNTPDDAPGNVLLPFPNTQAEGPIGLARLGGD